MKRILIVAATVGLFSQPVTAEWRLKSNVFYFHGAKFDVNSTHTSKAECEAEKTRILDYLQEVQPHLIPRTGMSCVEETDQS